jgi:beta-glucosidase
MNFDDARALIRAGTTPEDAARQVVADLRPDERLWCLDGDAPAWAGLGFLTEQNGYHRMPFAAAEVDRARLPGVHFVDGPRGCVVGNATAFPVSMARGATWDPELEERVGDAIGRELRAVGADLTGAVCVNILRHPAWGRAQETYGEDPHHVGELGAAFTRGLQRHVMACVKHFACNSMENSRFSVDIEVDEVALHEVYLPHFRRVIDEGVASVMTAYNSVNGDWCGQNRALITDVLRDEWGFQGFVISDFIFGLRDAAASLAAGLDIEMPYRMVRASSLATALERGDASWDDVDAAVTRIVATLLRFDDILSAPPPPREVLGAAEHRALAREVAAGSAVVLANEPVDGARILPLDQGSTVALFGPLADRINLGDGGSSDVWDLECSTILHGLRGELDRVTHDDGSDLPRAVTAAGSADVAVVVVGYTYADEGEYIGATDSALASLFPEADEPDVVERYGARVAEQPQTTQPDRITERPKGFSRGGDRSSLRLGADDVALIRAVAAANPRTVVVIQAGSAVVVREWIDDVPAIVQSWYGGCEAGTGLADVLIGRVDASGRLPFSVPRDESDLPPFDREATSFRYDRWHGWWHLARNGTAAEFPFGFGLSFTTFEIGASDVGLDDAAVAVRAVVRNTGERDGTDVIQVYAERPDVDSPARLVGFRRIGVLAGGEAEVVIRVPLERLATRDAAQRRWQPASGPHRITVARHAGDHASHRHDVVL